MTRFTVLLLLVNNGVLYENILSREELSKLMKERAAQLEVKLLLFAIQKTTSFEKLLAQRFANSVLQVEEQKACGVQSACGVTK